MSTAVSAKEWHGRFTEAIHPAIWRLLQHDSDENKSALVEVVAASLRSLIASPSPASSSTNAAVLDALPAVTEHLFAPIWEEELREMLETSVQAKPSDSGSAACDQPPVAAKARQVEQLFTAIWGEVLVFLQLVPLSVHARAAQNGNEESEDVDKHLPSGVKSAMLAITEGIFTLGREAAAATSAGEEDASLFSTALQQLWYAAAFLFLQQLSARNAHTIAAWKQFSVTCAEELKRDVTRGPTAARALAAWAATLTTTTTTTGAPNSDSPLSPVLLKETVERTRFRRAALLFKSFTPHMVSQAPGTTFLLVHTLDGFRSAWRTLLETEVLAKQAGKLTAAAREYFGGCGAARSGSKEGPAADFPATAMTMTPQSPLLGKMTPAEKQLAELVAEYADRLLVILGKGNVHGFLLATAIGSVVAARLVIPHPTRAPAASPRAAPATSTASSATSAPTPPPTRVLGRGMTGRAVGGALPTAATFAAPPTMTAAGLPALAASTAAASLPPMPAHPTADAVELKGVTATGTTAPDKGWLPPWSPSAAPLTASDVEWCLLEFAPLGLLMRRLSIYPYLQPHLFHFATQLKLGLGDAQYTEARERFTVACLLSGLVDPAVATAMFHFAAHPDHATTQTDFTGEAVSPGVAAGVLSGDAAAAANYHRAPGAALAAFTAAMNRYAAAADSEIVFDASATAGGAAAGAAVGGLGLLDSASGGRMGRRKRGARSGAAAANAEDAALMAQREEESRSRVPVPQNGELHGARFCVMVYPEVLPTWEQFLSAATGSAVVGASGAAATGSPVLTAPSRMVGELVSAHYFTQAARVVGYYLREAKVNVFLTPRAALSSSSTANANTARSTFNLQGQLAEVAKVGFTTTATAPLANKEFVRRSYNWLASLLPVLRLAGSYMASQEFVVRLLDCLTHMCRVALLEGKDGAVATVHGARRCLTLAELLLVLVVMPCLRVMNASPLVYNRLELLFACFERGHDDAQVRYGVNEVEYLHYSAWVRYLLPNSQLAQQQQQQQALSSNPGDLASEEHAGEASEVGWTADIDAGSPFDLSREDARQLFSASAFMSPSQYPHDRVRCKENEALFNQSLKRMNAHNVDYYRCLLRQVLYAEPLFVLDKLLTQAVGYENSFLPLHTRLLQGLPSPILALLLHHGLATLRRFAREEKITDGGASTNRVSLVATFLATVWRQNVVAFGATEENASEDTGAGQGMAGCGIMLLRAAETALRSDARQDMVLGVELLKALVFQLAHRKLEHEEQFSDAQQKALVTPTHATRFFGRGSMESFRMARWSPWLTPADIAAGTAALEKALLAPCRLPVKNLPCHINSSSSISGEDEQAAALGGAGKNSECHDGDGDGDDDVPAVILDTLNIGQCLLLHLCRLHARVYRLQADLDGPMDLVLLTSAKDFNSLNDLIFILTEMLPQGPPEALLANISMAHMALALSGHFRVAAYSANIASEQKRSAAFRGVMPPPPPSAELLQTPEERPWRWLARMLEGGLSYALVRQLSCFTAAHLGFDEDAYEAALAEWKACKAKADPRDAIKQAPANGTTNTNNTSNGHLGTTLGTGEKRGRDEGGVNGDAVASAAAAASSPRRSPEEEERQAEQQEKLREERKRLLAATDVGTAVWLREQLRLMEEEKLVHRALVIEGEGARSVLFQRLMDEVLAPQETAAHKDAEADPRLSPEEVVTAFAMDYLLPRALLSLSDTIFVERLLTWLLRKTNPHKQKDEEGRARRAIAHRRVTDLMLTLVTGGVALFTGLSDGECKRLGHLLAHTLRSLDSTATMPPLPATLAAAVASIQRAKLAEAPSGMGAKSVAGVSGVRDDAGQPSHSAITQCSEAQFQAYLAPAHPSTLAALLSRAQPSSASKQTGSEETPSTTDAAGGTAAAATASSIEAPPLAYPLQLEAFLCRFFVQYLGNKADIPPHLHRNCFLVLERLDKSVFPACLCSTELLLRVVALHASKDNRNYASALAVLKPMRENLRAKRGILTPLNDLIASSATSTGVAASSTAAVTASPALAALAHSMSPSVMASLALEAKRWFTLWRMRELYMEQQLLREEMDTFVNRQPFDPLHGGEEDEDEEAEDGPEDSEEHAAAGSEKSNRAEDSSGGDSASDEEDEEDGDGSSDNDSRDDDAGSESGSDGSTNGDDDGEDNSDPDEN